MFLDLCGLGVDLLNWKGSLPRFNALFPILLVFLHSASFLSNSYVVYEDAVLRYLSQACFVWLLFNRSKELRKKNWVRFNVNRLLQTYVGWKPFGYCLLALCFIRTGSIYNRCREEQTDCRASLFSLPFESLSSGKEVRFLLAVFSVLLLYFAVRWFLLRNGHLDGNSATVLLVRFGVPFANFAIVCFWTLQWLPESVLQRFPIQMKLIPPLLIYALFLVFVACYLWDPLLICLLDDSKGKKASISISPADGVLKRRDLAQHVVSNWSASERRSERVFAFGLATGFSGSVVAFCSFCQTVLLLLLGDGIASSGLGFSLLVVTTLELLSSGTCRFSLSDTTSL